MPTAPKHHVDDSTLRVPGQQVTTTGNNASSLAQSDYWSANTAPGEYELGPVAYQNLSSAQYGGPFSTPNQQLYGFQTAGIVGGLSTETLENVDRRIPAAHLSSSDHQLTHARGFYSNNADPSRRDDELAYTESRSQQPAERFTTPAFFSQTHQELIGSGQVTANNATTATVESIAARAPQRPDSALLQITPKPKPRSPPPSAERDLADTVGGWETGPVAEEPRWSQKSISLPHTNLHGQANPMSKDGPTGKITDPASSDMPSTSGDDIEAKPVGGAKPAVTQQRARQNGGGLEPPGILQAGKESRASSSVPVLPAEKVFPIQIGSELFRLSGASISSDGQCPSEHLHLL